MSNHIDLRDLRLIRRLAEHGSITGAAKQLNVTQSAASQRLAALHQRFDLPLFVKGDDGYQITSAGEALYRAAQRVDQELHQAFEQLKRLGAERHGSLRLTTQCYTCYRWLPIVIDQVRAQHPQVQIEVVAEATDEPYEALRSDRIDLAIVSDSRRPKRFDYAALFDDELYAVMASDHPLSKRRALAATDFADQNVIVYTGRSHPIMDQVLNPAGVSPRKLTQVRITEAIVELARAGTGVAILAGWAYGDLPDNSGLRAIRIGRQGFRRQWHAVSNRGYVSEPQRAFIAALRKLGPQLGLNDWRSESLTA